MTLRKVRRRMPIGAEPAAGGGIHFRVWAPRRTHVEVVLENQEPHTSGLAAEPNGYFSGHVPLAQVGSKYRFRLDGCPELFPDPASRFQPEGPLGPSEVVDPSLFPWTDTTWRGCALAGQVIYEIHLGTFTGAGTWAAAERELPELAAAGFTLLEVMPIADFPGRFGWGYDGVNLFAPTRLYGRPDHVRHFVDRAHSLGIGVILDVVYNHLGPDGNHLSQYSEHYFSDRYTTEWGEALNFDGTGSGPVRQFFLANAGYWIDEYHFDGLRLDATQAIHDASPEHILAAVSRRVRQAAGKKRRTILIAENEPQNVALLRPIKEGGCELDATWNDDFHRAVHVAMTGQREFYFADYHGTAQELISVSKRGFLYQGQPSERQRRRRGQPAQQLAPTAFVNYLENHDQVANHLHGRRSHELTTPARHRAVTAFLLLGPGTPMLFQGQEFAASSPFCFFADHHPELAKSIWKGRMHYVHHFASQRDPAIQPYPCRPDNVTVFHRCRLDFRERKKHARVYALHKDLIQLRREDNVFSRQQAGAVDGAVLAGAAFVLRFFNDNDGDRLLLVNLGPQLDFRPAPEPLLAPPAGFGWELLWSSEDARYGGSGARAREDNGGWCVPAESATAFRASRERRRPK